MTDANAHDTPGPSRRSSRPLGVSLVKLFGIEIRLDFSVLIVFALVVSMLALSVFPHWHPDWDPLMTWSVALVAGVLFFLSLLAHELSHSVVANARGIPVRRITLFVFGGVSEMQREPDTPASEFVIAIVGPVTSIVIGFVFSYAAAVLAGPEFAREATQDLAHAMAGIGPAVTMFMWLGPVNLMLGVFNLIPGFPLDGGRVLRSLLWALTRDLERATRWASYTGRAFAYTLMGLGVLQAFAGNVVGGLWLLLIGWFLGNAARGSYEQLLVSRAVDALVVRNLMRTSFESVAPDVRLDRFVEECLLRTAQTAWPVLDDGRIVGIVTFDDVRKIAEEERPRRTVRDAMSPVDQCLAPDTSGRDALQMLLTSEHDPIPVVENARVVGLLHKADIMRWLALHHLEAEN